MKVSKMVTIDVDIAELVRKRGINLSGVINEFMKSYLEISELEKTPAKELEIEIQKTEGKLSALKTHLDLTYQKEEREKKTQPKNYVERKGQLIEVDEHGFEVKQ